MSVRTSKILKVGKVHWTNDLRFYSFSTAFKSNKYDRRMIMKGSVSPIGSVYGWNDFRRRKSNLEPLGQ